MLLQGSAEADVYVLGNMFEFNRAIVWLDDSSEPSFANNVYFNNVQSDVCWHYENQIMHDQKLIYFIPKFGKLKDLECHYLNVSSTQSGCISLLGTVVATVYPQGTSYSIIIVLSFANGYCLHYGFF